MSAALRIAVDEVKAAVKIVPPQPLTDVAMKTPCSDEFADLMTCLTSRNESSVCVVKYAALKACLYEWGLPSSQK